MAARFGGGAGVDGTTVDTSAGFSADISGVRTVAGGVEDVASDGRIAANGSTARTAAKQTAKAVRKVAGR